MSCAVREIRLENSAAFSINEEFNREIAQYLPHATVLSAVHTFL